MEKENNCFNIWKLYVTLIKNKCSIFRPDFQKTDKFIADLALKSARKIFYNIDLAEQTNDPKLFKKLQSDIWEFRTKYARVEIRLLAFWDKTDGKETLVIATHGFIKKVDKVPKNEIERAVKIRTNYFENKLKNK